MKYTLIRILFTAIMIFALLFLQDLLQNQITTKDLKMDTVKDGKMLRETG